MDRISGWIIATSLWRHWNGWDLGIHPFLSSFSDVEVIVVNDWIYNAARFLIWMSNGSWFFHGFMVQHKMFQNWGKFQTCRIYLQDSSNHPIISRCSCPALPGAAARCDLRLFSLEMTAKGGIRSWIGGAKSKNKHQLKLETWWNE